jgi:hypothetical protein
LDLSGFLLNHQRRHHNYSLSYPMMAGNNRRNPMIKTLNLIAKPADEIPGCGPVQYGVASSSTC